MGSDDLIDGTFTPDQWSRLKEQFIVRQPSACALAPTACASRAQLGQKLFFEPYISGNCAVSCATCHDPNAAFIDSRPQSGLSLGAGGRTKRNSLGIVNVGLKLPNASHDDVFTWDGSKRTPGGVFEIAMRTGGPMDADPGSTATFVLATPEYRALYNAASFTDGDVITNIEDAFDAYLSQLISADAPFDRWLAGTESISDSAKRGFAVFVDRGTCLDCHTAPLFTDFDFHVTGVPQTGDADDGRAKVTMDPDDIGKFLTPSLRNVARTGPYMHDGVIATLPDVVEFYRRGGAPADYGGVKDPRIQPLDITDDDARDLVAFLGTLTGDDVPVQLRIDGDSPHAPRTRCGIGSAASCIDTTSDPQHCGSCNNACMPGSVCMNSRCVPLVCGPGLDACGNTCVDLQTDINNCGACGHSCATYCWGGMCGGL